MDHPMDTLTIGHLKLLVSAADGESFTLAARQAGTSPAAVSKVVRRLERRLGVPLFARTTRGMRLTDLGATYIARCRDALSFLDQAEQLAAGEQATPSGPLRVSVSGPYAYWRLLPKIAMFRERFPDITLTIQISDRSVNLTTEHFDLAIRGYAMPDSGLIAAKIEDAELVVIASPEYLAKAPAISVPDDLADHRCIQFRLPGSGRIAPWSFIEGGSRREIEIGGDIVLEDQYLGGVMLATAGAGLYQMYRFVVQDDLLSGRLVEVLPAYGGSSRRFNVIYSGAAALPARLRAFIDFVATEVAESFTASALGPPPKRY